MEKRELDRLVGENLKRERERCGYTQEEFSEMIEMNSKSLSAAERGVMGLSLGTILKICDKLSISSDTLLFKNTPANDVQSLAQQLQRLTPAQFVIAKDMFAALLAAFALEKDE